MKTVVFIEDERTLLKDLKKAFASSSLNCIFFNDGLKAWHYVKTHHVDLLCTDIHMPGCSGMDLLESLQKDFPNVMAVAMIEYTSKNLIKELLTHNLALHIIFKPWNKKEVKSDVIKILNTKEALHSNALMSFIGDIEKFPTLPDVYFELSEMVQNHASIEEVSRRIEKDIALTAFVLKVANSPLYGRKTSNVGQAIMKIGLISLKDIVLSYSVFTLLEKDKMQLERLWEKAILTNDLLSRFYQDCLEQSLPMAYASVGLLHDIGQLFLLTYIEKTKDNVNIDFPTHDNLGGYLLYHWGLPLAYVEGAMFHLRPFDDRIVHKKLIFSLYLVHYFLNDFGEKEEAEKIIEALGLKNDIVQHCFEDAIKLRG